MTNRPRYTPTSLPRIVDAETIYAALTVATVAHQPVAVYVKPSDWAQVVNVARDCCDAEVVGEYRLKLKPRADEGDMPCVDELLADEIEDDDPEPLPRPRPKPRPNRTNRRRRVPLPILMVAGCATANRETPQPAVRERRAEVVRLIETSGGSYPVRDAQQLLAGKYRLKWPNRELLYMRDAGLIRREGKSLVLP